MTVSAKNIPAPDLVPVRRALISVSDKTGIVDFARSLAAREVALASTGGTAALLARSGIGVMDVSQLTGFPEIMDGRVKTLHPAVHGGLLAIRDDPDHRSAMETHAIKPIDLVVINLYPFEDVRFGGGDYAATVENIDIGGPAMLRAAAKNHAYVAVVTDPADYARVLEALEKNDGALPYRLRQELAAKAYARTAAYDAAISQWFAESLAIAEPEWRSFGGRLAQVMRYGENPHQQAALYLPSFAPGGTLADHKQVQGKELSYNNLNDADAALELVSEFRDGPPTVVIVKHANPCGVATGETLIEAYRNAFECDSVSAFGGIIALNRPLDGPTAEAISEIFTEVVCAPDADEAAKAVFAKKKNLRLILTGPLPDPKRGGMTLKTIAGGVLVQTRDNGHVTREQLRVVTKRAPTAQELDDCLFAWTIAKHVKSNAIVYAKDGATAGIGAGQMNRRDSARIAAIKAREAAETFGWAEPRTVGSAVASDAFFPFPDGLLAAAEAGASAVIQPGGSVKDEDVIAAADEAGLAMIFTGMRHFRH